MALAIETPPEVRAWADAARASGKRIALVPTMGALHRGHLELIGAASRLADRVVVSIFVNPLQFGEQGDFDHYPRPLHDDLRTCEAAGVDVVYIPTAATMYPAGFSTTVGVSGVTDTLEGASRPGHFDGVTTVVTKLFAASRADVAVFGEKDYQQLVVVRRMSTDLDLGVEIIAHPTVREPDGLALSSRNQRLDDRQRQAAICVPRAISAAIEQVKVSGSGVDDVVAAATDVINDEPLAALDYVAVFDARTLCPIGRFESQHRQPGRIRLAVAARFGEVRLIDNADLFTR